MSAGIASNQRRRAGRIDYHINNWCSTCNLLHSKNVYRCRQCNRTLRSKPAAAIRKKKYQKGVTRY